MGGESSSGGDGLDARSVPLPHLGLQQVIECAPDGVLVVDDQGVIRYANPVMGTLCGVLPDDLVGQSVDMLMAPEVRARHQGHIQRYFAQPYTRAMGNLGKLRLWHRGGHEIPVDISLGHVPADDGASHAILFVRDATQANEQRQQLEQMAMRDALTGLHNRRMFHEQLGQALSHAMRSGRGMAVCLVDLDDFKSVNDGYGHEAGDELLREVARRLRECLRAGDLLARLGGDEFAVLIRDIAVPDVAVNVARKIIEQLMRPIVLSNGTVFSGGSVGIAYGPDDATDTQSLMRYVDMALYMAKGAGRGTHAIYNPEMAQRLSENLKLRERLQHALDQGRLKLHYQPQVEGGVQRMVSVEALLRWHDPELGDVPPDRFIGVAESTGLILPLGDWVLDEACRQIAEWSAQGRSVRVAVNVSAQQFRHRDLAKQVRDVLDRHGVSPDLLELEVTETVAMNDPEQAAVTLNTLAAMGVKVALDDFGRGHSSLSYLLQLPVSRLKIDRSFIGGIPGSAEHVKLTRAIIGLAATLGKSLVAEGVETAEQRAFLAQEGCDCCQGWLFSKAVPADELNAVWERLQQ